MVSVHPLFSKWVAQTAKLPAINVNTVAVKEFYKIKHPLLRCEKLVKRKKILNVKNLFEDKGNKLLLGKIFVSFLYYLFLLNFNSLIALEEKSWDLNWDLINDRCIVQLDMPS